VECVPAACGACCATLGMLYDGYVRLSDAVHAWCGAHGLHDLKGLYEFDPDGQVWARSIADLLIRANKQAIAACIPVRARPR
jgi:hypothetical protein